MAMHSVFPKEREGIPLSTVPWWSRLGSPPRGCDQQFGLLKSPARAENPSPSSEELPERNPNHEVGKGNPDQFTIFAGNSKSPPKGQKFQLQCTGNVQAAAVEFRGHLELGFGQPVVCAKYPYGEQCYGVFAPYGPQLAGRIMLPFTSTSDEAPIFVNVKQYHGILRRRKYRAKAELENNKALKNRKPYLHLSRHLHAMRRPRGCGGRFLNTKALNGSKDPTDEKLPDQGQFSHRIGSQSCEVFQSDGGNSSSPRESNSCRSSNLGSEVTSVYSRVDLDPFIFNNLCTSSQPLPDMMNTGHGFVLPGKWVAAADSCRNLKV